MSWISVDEQLPVTADDVLAYSPSEGCFRAWYDNDIWFNHEANNKSKPSFWMYLPPAPQEAIANGQSSYGMTDNLVSGDTRPYSVWSETAQTAIDIKKAWESRFGGPYKILKGKNGFVVKYVGEWSNPPIASAGKS